MHMINITLECIEFIEGKHTKDQAPVATLMQRSDNGIDQAVMIKGQLLVGPMSVGSRYRIIVDELPANFDDESQGDWSSLLDGGSGNTGEDRGS